MLPSSTNTINGFENNEFVLPLAREPSHFDSDNASTGYSPSIGGTESISTLGNSTFAIEGVKRDNRMVTLVRVAVMCILLSACVVVSTFAYKITRKSQMAAFEAAFEGVASKLGPGFVSDLSLRMWQAGTIAAAVKAKIIDTQVKPHLLDIDAGPLYDVTQEARTFSSVHLMGWNPLLSTEQERMEFEVMATASDAPANSDSHPVCHLCETNGTISNPDFYMDLPGIGPTSCGQLEVAGLAGLIPGDSCDLVKEVLNWGCLCVEGTLEAPAPVDRATRVSRIDPESGTLVSMEDGNAPYMPLWNIADSAVHSMPTLMDRMSLSHTRPAIDRMMEMKLPMYTESVIRTGPFYEKYTGDVDGLSTTLLYPVVVDDDIVGSVTFDLLWKDMITSVIPGLSEHVHIVVENSLGQNFTFGVDPEQEDLVLIGEGDLHEEAFDEVVFSTTYEDFSFAALLTVLGDDGIDIGPLLYCRYRFHVFAKQELKDLYVNRDPIFYGAVTAAIFVFTSLVFVLYDFLVRRVQRKVVASAKHTRAIVSSLFPKNVRDRLIRQAAEQSNATNNNTDAPMRMSKMRIESFLTGGTDDETTSMFNTDPIADLFPSATVMFLDIVSFTAWSSEREPSQVFILLETIYQSFDVIAGRLKVFKVETIGDSYVAVCGLPTRREGHAPIMAKFAQRCLAAMQTATKDLEVQLGPSTGDLKARVGLHSGPVTAGVLRGEKARFQLFGDTVNTASRLESTGQPDCIHVSQSYVDLLEKAGKRHWAVKRDKLVAMKGKGELQTYFLECGIDETVPDDPIPFPLDKSSREILSGSRMIEFNTEVLYEFLKRIVVHRHAQGVARRTESLKLSSLQDGNLVIDELTQKLCLPAEARNTSTCTDAVTIQPEVKFQLHAFVKKIATTYRDVPFHNLEHCSHVLMSTSKLMKRIVNPDDVDYKQTDDLVAVAIHKTTYGISSDPILQFASLFAALIHDVDHTGLTNEELITAKVPLAAQYRNQSVAEQHSVDLAWSILMEPIFCELRKCIYQTEEDLGHFRQLVVNAVMATDIADKQLKQARETRWAETFPATPSLPESAQVYDEPESQHDRDRKATIVFEYIIQASDVCHTMQHWHTYQKFNKRLFEERYVAWLNGNLKKEPSLGWYGGELWFFDNYIIPMAQKLDQCGVFGASYQEYLTYAIANRTEWERKGKEIVDEMKARCDRKYSSPQQVFDEEDDAAFKEEQQVVDKDDDITAVKEMSHGDLKYCSQLEIYEDDTSIVDEMKHHCDRKYASQIDSDDDDTSIIEA